MPGLRLLPRLCLTVLLLALGSLGARSAPQSPPPKLINLGWDLPTPAWLRSNTVTAQERGFDALIVGPEVGRTVFTRVPHGAAGYARERADLRAVGPKRLQGSFLLLEATLGDYTDRVGADHAFDWFDDAHWASAQANLRQVGATVGSAGLRGIFFDSEPYFGTRPWGYLAQPNRGGRTFAQYETQLRRRGAQFMRALEAGAPGLTVFTTRFLSTVESTFWPGTTPGQVRATLPDNEYYGLWLAFAEGMLEGASPRARFIDGLERTYGNASAAQFAQARDWARNSLPLLLRPANRAKYAAQVSFSNGMYLDGLLNDDLRFLGAYLPDAATRLKLVEHNVYHGLQNADEYAWVFSEAFRFWNGEPDAGVRAALGRGRQKARSGAPLGFTPGVGATLAGAGQRYASRVQFAGFIVDAAGKGLAGVTLRSSAPGVRCEVSAPDGLYTCVSVPGWSGTLTPIRPGGQFDPPSRTYSGVTQGQFGQGYRQK